MTESVRITSRWLFDHPVPGLGAGSDKEGRGTVLVVGGSRYVPGAVRLTADAALRAGAGKVQIATLAELAIALGVLVPEAATIALPPDDAGEIAVAAAAALAKPAGRCDALAFGCGMMETDDTAALVTEVLGGIGEDASVLLDAAAMTALRDCAAAALPLAGRLVLTPHPGELARLMDADIDEICREPQRSAHTASERFGAVVALKSDDTVIASPDGAALIYTSDAPGLGTAGSGDVLAGVIGGLLARGAPALVAAAWGVWLHGEAGKAAASAVGPLGFLARELSAHIPHLMAAQSGRP